MKFLVKIVSINLLVFFAYSFLIEIVTQNDWEGFAYTIYYIFFIGLQVIVNLILTIVAATRKNSNLKFFLMGLILTIIIAIVMYLKN